MKVGLINTGLDENSPPMNLVYLATSLKLDGFDDVKIVDQTFGKRNMYRHLDQIDLAGISAMTKYYNRACDIARQIKSHKQIPVIVGGAHISTAAGSLSKYIDIGVLGEGDNILPKLCGIFKQEKRFEPERLSIIPGIVYRNGDKTEQTQPAELKEDLDDIPMPDFNFLDERYFKRKWINWAETMGRLMHITTSRGCPYNCVFCATKRFWKKTRFHSAKRIFSEVSELVNNWGIDHIVVDDDLFLARKERLSDLINLMDEGGLAGKVAFSCNARSNRLDEDMCRLLKKLGVKSLNFGFESGSDKMLKYLKGDNITVDSHKSAIQLCREYGFKVYGSLIFGSPTETIDDMKKTLDFIDYTIENKCQKVWAFVLTPLPGTPLWETAKERGIVSDEMDWDKLDLNSCENPMLLDADVDREEFEKIFNLATAKLDRAWMKDKWIKMVVLENRKVIRRIFENPKRAVSMFKNIFINN